MDRHPMFRVDVSAKDTAFPRTWNASWTTLRSTSRGSPSSRAFGPELNLFATAGEGRRRPRGMRTIAPTLSCRPGLP